MDRLPDLMALAVVLARADLHLPGVGPPLVVDLLPAAWADLLPAAWADLLLVMGLRACVAVLLLVVGLLQMVPHRWKGPRRSSKFLSCHGAGRG